jgi:PEP-CTERM motif
MPMGAYMQSAKSFRRTLTRAVCLSAMLTPLVAKADTTYGVVYNINVNYTAFANDPVPQVILITGSVLNTNPFPVFTTLLSAAAPYVCPGCIGDAVYNDQGGGKFLAAGLGTGNITLATLTIPAYEPLPSDGYLFYDAIFLGVSPGGDTGAPVVSVFAVPFTAVPEPSSLILLGTVLPLFGVVIRKKFAT